MPTKPPQIIHSILQEYILVEWLMVVGIDLISPIFTFGLSVLVRVEPDYHHLKVISTGRIVVSCAWDHHLIQISFGFEHDPPIPEIAVFFRAF